MSKSYIHITLLTVGLFLLLGCSSTTWIVESTAEVDRGDYKLLNSELFLQQTDQLSPEQPVIQIRLKSANTYEYVQRVKTDRYIQKYRPRAGYVAFGLASAGLAGYSALEFTDDDKVGQQVALLGAAVALTGVSFLNMKPVGEPQPTGESRLLRKTGSFVETDTLDANNSSVPNATYYIRYNDEFIIEPTQRELTDNILSINLAEEINPEIFEENENPEIALDISFQDSTYSYNLKVSDFFEPFVVVTNNITALRNEAEISSTNILTDLAKGSQLKLVSKQGDWYKVLYGISENWVSASDVEQIWRPSQFTQQLSVIAIPNVPFGSVDVERDIPRLSPDNRDRWGFIIANQNYKGDYPEKSFAHRDALLMERYMNNALGIVTNQTIKFLDVSGNQTARNGFNRLSTRMQKSNSELVVYLSGYAQIDPQTDRIYFLGTDTSDSTSALIDLNSLFDGLANLPANKLTVIADLDFTDQTEKAASLEVLAATITVKKPNALVVFASNVNQQSYIYSEPNGVQKRHSIFSYYIADAIKTGLTNWQDILSYVERNVAFTSRSLFNRPQDIQYFGSTTLDLID
ncbi:caspase family protein [Balneola vulgaris]|uniref:caspase family protein n=1 Tax=Balneola vulgaris TaxID=287535 RepID=UPI00146135EB|nr:caspase family protein [Balneola vulgaris]